MREPIFGLSDQVLHKPGFAFTEAGQRLEISDLGAKTKVLISSAFLFSHMQK